MKNRIPAQIVYDSYGNITSLSIPAAGAKIIAAGGESESVLLAEIENSDIGNLIKNHRVDVDRKILVRKKD